MPTLGARYAVIAPDLRGGDASDKPATNSGFTKRVMVEDVHALVTRLGFEQVIVVVHDIGMMLVYAYASRHPNETKGLVASEALLPGLEPLWSEMLKSYYSWHRGFHAEVELAARPISSHV
jgi:pimeloyl-ACP methyl ester carboxylesterase